MEYNGYVSLETIGDKLLRHPLMRGISYEAIIDYAIDFMRIVQCVGFFEERCTVVKVENYKGILPEDYFEMNQVRLVSNTIAPNIVDTIASFGLLSFLTKLFNAIPIKFGIQNNA